MNQRLPGCPLPYLDEFLEEPVEKFWVGQHPECMARWRGVDDDAIELDPQLVVALHQLQHLPRQAQKQTIKTHDIRSKTEKKQAGKRSRLRYVQTKRHTIQNDRTMDIILPITTSRPTPPTILPHQQQVPTPPKITSRPPPTPPSPHLGEGDKLVSPRRGVVQDARELFEVELVDQASGRVSPLCLRLRLSHETVHHLYSQCFRRKKSRVGQHS